MAPLYMRLIGCGESSATMSMAASVSKGNKKGCSRLIDVFGQNCRMAVTRAKIEKMIAK